MYKLFKPKSKPSDLTAELISGDDDEDDVKNNNKKYSNRRIINNPIQETVTDLELTQRHPSIIYENSKKCKYKYFRFFVLF